MAAGFVDYLRMILGWKSSGTGAAAVGGPYRVAEAEVFATGRTAGEVFSDGRTAGQVFAAGTVAGEVDGRSS